MFHSALSSIFIQKLTCEHVPRDPLHETSNVSIGAVHMNAPKRCFGDSDIHSVSLTLPVAFSSVAPCAASVTWDAVPKPTTVLKLRRLYDPVLQLTFYLMILTKRLRFMILSLRLLNRLIYQMCTASAIPLAASNILATQPAAA